MKIVRDEFEAAGFRIETNIDGSYSIKTRSDGYIGMSTVDYGNSFNS